MFLESFRIMDYSLLVGIHNLDQAAKEQAVSPVVLLYYYNCRVSSQLRMHDYYLLN